MHIVQLKDYQSFAEEKMKKLNVFETPRFFCDVYCFEPGQVQKAHAHGNQDKQWGERLKVTQTPTVILDGNIRIRNLNIDNLKIVIQSILEQDKKS